MFLLKKLLGHSLLPLSLTLLLLTVGLLLLWLTRRQLIGKVLVSLAALLLLAQSYGWGFNGALRELERTYLPLQQLPPEVGWVVVLGGGTYGDASLPLHATISSSSLARLVEGVRLYRQRPGVKLLVSGGRAADSGADADSMADLALQLGVNPADIVRDDFSADTEAQAQVVKRMVGDAPVALVTCASHMPRSMGLFQRAGVKAVAAPTQFLVQDGAGWVSDMFPEAKDLFRAYRAVYEYLGIGFAKLRGVMG